MNTIQKPPPSDVSINIANARSVPSKGLSSIPFAPPDNPAIVIETHDNPEFKATTPQLFIHHIGSLVEATDSQGEPADQTHYLRASTSLSGDFYLEVTVFGNEPDFGSVWLLFAPNSWFSLGPTDRFSESALHTSGIWAFEATSGSLTHEGVLCAQDGNSATTNVTVGFGVAQFHDDEGNDQWSVFYVNNDGRGKEFVTMGRLPGDLYPVLLFDKPGQKVSVNYAGPFKHKDCKPVCIPHRGPVGLYEYSPDRRHVASYGGEDGTLSVWRLHDSQSPELVSHTSIDDMKIIDTSEEVERYHHEQLTIVVSNTKGREIPHVVLSRYHKDLEQENWRILFLELTTTGKKERYLRKDSKSRVAGHLHLLDDGNTLLIVNAQQLFVVDMKARSLLRTFSTRELDYIGTIRNIGLYTAGPGAPPLQPFDSEHFLWHIAGFVTLWHTSTGHLKQVFRLTLQSGEKYDYDKRHNLVAFYGGMGLRVFTIQTGMLIIETKVPEDFRSHIAGVRFMMIGNNLHLMTIECDEKEYIVRIWNPLTGQSTSRGPKPHKLFARFQNCSLHGNGLSPISLVTQLSRTITYMPVEDPFPKADTAIESETLDQILKNPPIGSGHEMKIETVQFQGLPSQIQLQFKSLIFAPEPWNQDVPACKWLSENLLMIIGKQTVQIIDVASSSRRGLAIKHIWCVPRVTATISDIKLDTAKDTKVLQQFTVAYQLESIPRTDIIDVDLMGAELSPKHASRYIQFSGVNFQSSKPCVVYKQVLKLIMDSDTEIFNLNAVDFETSTSTFGHIIRGPQEASRERVKTFLDNGAFRPQFYDEMLRDKSALTEALAIKDFTLVTEIVRYCLKRASTEGDRSRQLEPGYIAIVVAALPAINRVKPRLATQIAQYISNIPLGDYAKGFREAQRESGETDMFAFACVEKLSDAGLSRSMILEWIKSLPFFKWTENIWQTRLAAEEEGRQTLPVISCVSPLYGLNRYPPKASPFQHSPFAELAFSHSAVFDEPAFQAVVQYKWNKFAGWYYLLLIFLYTSFALLYFVAVSIQDPHVLAIAGVKWTIVVIAALCLLLFDARLMYYQWRNWAYWISIYRWIDRCAFVMVLISTLLTSPDYDDLSVNLQAWTVLILWLFVVFNFRVYEGMGLFINVLIDILGSIGWLLVLMIAIVFAFAHALLILLRSSTPPAAESNPFTSIDSSLKTLWAFLGGDFAAIDGWDAGRSVDIMRVIFSFVTTIVLLNVLIAILNNVFTASRDRAEKTWIRNRAEFIAIVEEFFLTANQRQDGNWFPSIVFYEVDAEKFEQYYESTKMGHDWIKMEIEEVGSGAEKEVQKPEKESDAGN